MNAQRKLSLRGVPPWWDVVGRIDLHGVYPEPGHKRFFASLRMTKSEGFAMTFFLLMISFQFTLGDDPSEKLGSHGFQISVDAKG